MPRRQSQMFQILRESIRIILLRPTHFHFISIFVFSPLPFSLFIFHFLIHRSPEIPSSTIKIMGNILGYPLPQILSRTVIHLIICFPASITFSLLGRAATIQVVSDYYNGINLDRRRLLRKSGSAWIKLLHTSLWEYLIVFSLFTAFVALLATVPTIQFASGFSAFLGLIGFLGVPFCVIFAHVMVLGNLARVLTVLENKCYGVDSFFKANSLMEGRRQTALVMALLSNMSFRLVECLFELRICKNNMSVWEGSLLVSMYSSVLVLDTVMNAVFYYACKTIDN